MIQQAPPQARQNKELYYAWLVSNGFPAPAAWDEMVKVFGKPKTRQEQADAQARAAQGSQLRQVGGAVAGTAATGWALDGFPAPKIPSWAKGAPTAPTATPTANGGMSSVTVAPPSSGGMSSAATPNSSFNQHFSVVDPGSMPGGSAAPPGLTAIQSNADGTIKMVPTEALGDQGFLGGVNWGSVAQGAAGAAQLYGAYQSYKSGDKFGAGLSGASGAGNIALASGAASSTGTLGASVVPGLNIATGLYGGYKTAEATANMAAGGQRNKMAAIGGLGAGAGVGLGLAGLGAFGAGGMMTLAALGPVGWIAAGGLALAVLGSSAFGSKKGKAQFTRDRVRKSLKEGGLLDDNYQGSLADGSSFDFGKDGKSMKTAETDKIGAANPNAWGSTVSLANTLTAGQGFSGRSLSDVASMWARAAVSNAGDDPAKAAANIKHFAIQQGMTAESITAQLDKGLADNNFSQGQYDIYANNIKSIFGAPGAGSQPVNSMALVRPKKGEVQRVSAGMYRDDTGKLRGSSTMRGALDKAYGKTKAKA